MSNLDFSHIGTDRNNEAEFTCVLIKEYEALKKSNDILLDVMSLKDDGLRLRFGEMTSQEIRTVRAVCSYLISPLASIKRDKNG